MHFELTAMNKKFTTESKKMTLKKKRGLKKPQRALHNTKGSLQNTSSARFLRKKSPENSLSPTVPDLVAAIGQSPGVEFRAVSD